jgi:hypothetical protein
MRMDIGELAAGPRVGSKMEDIQSRVVVEEAQQLTPGISGSAENGNAMAQGDPPLESAGLYVYPHNCATDQPVV